jgi:hypothetical protein
MVTTATKRRVVHVTASTASGYANATGIVVSPGRVLTTAHVLRDWSKKSLEIRLCELEPDHWIPSEVVWDGREHGGWDAMVLKFDPDKTKSASREACKEAMGSLLMKREPRSHQLWEIYGLPDAGYATDFKSKKSIATPMELRGSSGSRNPDNHFDLAVNVTPTHANGWRGASGSAVFIEGCLVGMCVEAREPIPSALRALWSGAFVNANGFVEAAGLGELESSRQQLMASIAERLAGADREPLRAALWRALKSESSREGILAEAIAGLTIPRLLGTANRVLDELVGDKARSRGHNERELARVMETLVDELLPEAVDPALIEHLSPSWRGGMSFVKLPCSTAFVAELYAARLDRRRITYAEKDLDDFDRPGAFRVELPPQAHGINSDSNLLDGAVSTVLAHFCDQLRIPKSLRGKGTNSEMSTQVNRILQVRADPDKTTMPHRWYLLVTEETQRGVAERLSKLLGELRSCELLGLHLVDSESSVNADAEMENEICELLRTYLERRNNQGAST